MSFKTLLIGFAFAAGTFVSSCKSKTDKDNQANDTSTMAPSGDTASSTNMQAPVSVAPYDTLAAGVRDATKDFPGVKADVDNGEITLTGEIKRDQLQRLMMAVSSLHAKKVNNRLTIK